MTLPYTLRLICLLVVVTGVVHAALQGALTANARRVMRMLRGWPARQQERILLCLQMGPPAAALLFAGALCAPQYLRHEANHAAEGVSWACVALACAALIWFAATAASGLRVWLRTVRFTRACRRSATVVGRHAGIPVLAVSESEAVVALAGFRRPAILVSRKLLERDGLGEEALQVAFEHERAHAQHRDNWKLLALSFVPQLPGSGWMQHWQIAADCVADDDAAQGDVERGLLLAETLVRVARCAGRRGRPVLCTALSSGEAGLRERVERLTGEREELPGTRGATIAAMMVFAAVAIAAAVSASPWVYEVCERILHLG